MISIVAFCLSLGPLFIISFFLFILVASIFGEHHFEDPETGSSTILGNITIMSPYIITGSLFVLGITSVIVEKITKGRIKIATRFLKFVSKKLKRVNVFRVGLYTGIVFVLLGVYSLYFPSEYEVGANIGGGITIITGSILASGSAAILILRGKILDRS
ncbi:MAG: hypothetical protein ACI9T8_000240 [Candidatus Saccharimonadales bacterium]|jgi:hypothetical protein